MIKRSSERNVGRRAGPGRKKGVPNQVTAELKAMILQSLDDVGGVDYLRERALDPKTAPAFLTLLGKILPMQVTGGGGRTLADELAGLNVLKADK